MNDIVNSFKSAALSVGELLTPVLSESKFKETGVLTPEEFVAAGDHLVHHCPTWSWSNASLNKAKDFLPEKKQFLVTKNVPCYQRCSAMNYDESMGKIIDECGIDGETIDEWVDTHHFSNGNQPTNKKSDAVEVVNKPHDIIHSSLNASGNRCVVKTSDDDDDDDEGAPVDMNAFMQSGALEDEDPNVFIAKPSAPMTDSSKEQMEELEQTRTYDLHITYDKYYQVPRFWLVGYDEQGQPLTVHQMKEDFSQEHADRTITLELHPQVSNLTLATIHPCRHAAVMKRLIEQFLENGKELSVLDYIFVFLKFVQMYVDPELLEHLEEEQKLLLFIKMREEQVRRWKANEARLADEEARNGAGERKNAERRASNKKRVQWRTGMDGEVWVWVMGEHPNDLTIEQMIENETKNKARQLAEREILFESLKLDNKLLNDTGSLDEETLKSQLMQIQLCPNPKSLRDSADRHSQYDDLSGIDDSVVLTLDLRKSSSMDAPQRNASNLIVRPIQIQQLRHSDIVQLPSTNLSSANSGLAQQRSDNENLAPTLSASRSATTVTEPEEFVQFTRSYIPGSSTVSTRPSNATVFHRNAKDLPALSFPVDGSCFIHSAVSSTTAVGSPIASTTVFASAPAQGGTPIKAPIQPINKTTTGKLGYEAVTAGNGGGGRVGGLAARLSAGSTLPQSAMAADPKKSMPPSSEQRPNGRVLERTSTTCNPTSGTSEIVSTTIASYSMPTPIGRGDYYDNYFAPRENELSTPSPITMREDNDDPISHLRSVLRDRAPANFQCKTEQISQPAKPPIAPPSDGQVKLRAKGGTSVRARILRAVDDQIEKRQSQILEQLRDKQERMKRDANTVDEQEREQRAWEEQEKKAREAETQIRLIAQKARQEHLKMRTSSSLLPAVNDTTSTSLKEAIIIPRPPKPQSRAVIVQWYVSVERPNGTGIDTTTNKPFVWFHGIISRTHAEDLLLNLAVGSYLVRVSERIWGYTISYMGADGLAKHFLVEKIAGGYQFLGTNQVVHQSLADLVRYHHTTAITLKGGEKLLYPVGQRVPSSPDHAELF